MKYKIAISLALLSVLAFQPAIAAPSLFQPYVNFPIIESGLAVGIGDFNSDGLNDVAVTSADTYATINNLSIMLQSADGALGEPTVYSTGSYPSSLAIGDLNNDGRTDIVTANQVSAEISVFLQQNDGLMADQILYSAVGYPNAVAVGDINNDGLADIVVAYRGSPLIGVFTQNTDGTLRDVVTYTSPQTGYADIEIADINNDGKNDVIKMNGRVANSNFYVHLQNTAGTLEPPLSYSVANCPSGCYANAIETGDITGDGLNDIILAYESYQDSHVAVFSQASDGSLQSSISYDTYYRPETLAVVDANLDGYVDVLTAHGGESLVGVSLQLNGTLTPYTLYSVPSTPLYEYPNMDAGDINNDGAPDIVITDYYNGLTVLYHVPIDYTPPAISVAALKDDNTPYIPGTWTNQTVTVKFTCSDAESGIASCPEDQVFDNDGITTETTGTAIDNSGNNASASFGPIQIDKTPPVVFIGVSPNPVLLNGDAELSRNATDNLSGIDNGPCTNIITSTVGFKSVTCWIYDYAGNTTKATTTYRVIYDFVGFLSPVDDCINNICEGGQDITFKPGSTIPFKFQLKDATGEVIQALSDPLWLVPAQFDYLPIILPDNFEFQVSDSTYEWRKNHKNYVYEWSTRGLLNPSIWLVGVRLDDGMTYYVFVALAK